MSRQVRNRRLPAPALAALAAYNDSLLETDPAPADARLLPLSGLEEVGIARANIKQDIQGQYVEVWFQKPDAEGLTERLLDIPMYYLLLLHFISGVWVEIDRKGKKNGYYFPKVNFKDKPSGIMLGRLVTDAQPGYLAASKTKEGEFKDLRRSAPWRFSKHPTAKYGREDAISWSCEKLATALAAGEGNFGGLTPRDLDAMLRDGYAFLDQHYPLGTSDA
ncbi:hypothetical protein [Chthonobacter albigriseus]|uniref:hypothetical protein n=1 Tax=Chthonobacter albigriseus TaxID=1683161 RepID=UPI0015EF34CE|nr:hypothetical protein [Chthonobacter albigriseus]